jgi:uncharacterized protein YndB with AHSA1/START domain
VISARRRTVTVERVVPATADRIFAVLADPVQHAHLDGSGMLRGARTGPDRLHLGARFGMAMKQGPFSYTSRNEVTVFAPDRALAWRTTGQWRGRTVIGGQWWRYTLLPAESGTLVRHSYEWGRAALATLTVWLPGYPRRMARTMPRTLQRLEEAVLGQ